jgi:lambda repressor-like predicted transcriptional regulator
MAKWRAAGSGAMKAENLNEVLRRQCQRERLLAKALAFESLEISRRNSMM